MGAPTKLPGKRVADDTLKVNNASSFWINKDAVVPPTINADFTAGYRVGSYWIDNAAKKIYFCVDATTGAAVWQQGVVFGITSEMKEVLADAGDASAGVLEKAAPIDHIHKLTNIDCGEIIAPPSSLVLTLV